MEIQLKNNTFITEKLSGEYFYIFSWTKSALWYPDLLPLTTVNDSEDINILLCDFGKFKKHSQNLND